MEESGGDHGRFAGAQSPVSPSASSAVQISSNTPSKSEDMSDEISDEADELGVSNMSDEDAQYLIEPSISMVATRLKSPNTPALEKAAAMEALDDGFFVDSESGTPVLANQGAGELAEEVILSQSPIEFGGEIPSHPIMEDGRVLLAPSPRTAGDLQNPRVSWHADSAPSAKQGSSSLQGMFDAGRKRSLSGSATSFRKLFPKILPSAAQVGNFFGSSSMSPKSYLAMSTSLPNDSGLMQPRGQIDGPLPSGSSVTGQDSLNRGYSRHQTFESIVTTPNQEPQPRFIRRISSDNSLMYNSLSRASSLGDDSRFEHHHDQVNSRVKAIRDSIQSRSSFRMPQIPNIPRVPSFSFNMNFLNGNNVTGRFRSNSDVSYILPTNMAQKKPNLILNSPITTAGISGASFSRAKDAAAECSQQAVAGLSMSSLDRAMESLTGDVVIMGGYRGSILRSAKPPHRRLWVPVKVGLNIRKVDLEVGLEPEDEERMPETIFASGMLQNIGPVDISKRLFKRLRECENARNGTLRVWDYGYDWRLSPHLLSRKLTDFLEKLPSNQPDENSVAIEKRGAFVIAHSLGGIITRHVVNHRPELFSGVVYAGVPQSCINILGPIRNGDAVLLSSRVLTAQVNFTLRTSFVLLPEDGACFIDINTKERYPVDFFNVEDWIKYRLSPCTDPPLPPIIPPSLTLGALLYMSGSRLSLPSPGKMSIYGFGSSHPSAISSTTQVDIVRRDPTKTPPNGSPAVDIIHHADSGKDKSLEPQMGGNVNPGNKSYIANSSVSTTVTLSRDKAIAYLERTLGETKKFKKELHFRPELSKSNHYPPLAVIYGKSIPTVYGAKVHGKEGIPCADVYDNLAFASGDGVCLAKEAMLPEGYQAVYGGRISSDRGHVTLLGDLNAVGRAIEAVVRGRAKGIGLGL